jgi:uncharacterized protein (DUF885 family)
MRASIKVWLTAGVLLALSSCTTTQTGDAASRDEAALTQLADRMIALELRASPLLGYFADIGVSDHRRWSDLSPAVLRAYETDSDALLQSLGGLDVNRLTPSDRAIVASMRERLESRQQMRVCRRELWDVSHMGGWHLSLSTAAREQPVETAEERAWAMERWSALPAYVDQQIANARQGSTRATARRSPSCAA